MRLTQEELKTVIMLWQNHGSGVASYGALEHLLHSSFGNSVHSAAPARLIMSKLTKGKHGPILHFRPSRQKHAKTQVNRLKQSRN